MADASKFWFTFSHKTALFFFFPLYMNCVCLCSSSQAENYLINVFILSFCLSLWDIGTEAEPAMTSGSPSDLFGELPLEYTTRSSTPDLQKGMVYLHKVWQQKLGIIIIVSKP